MAKRGGRRPGAGRPKGSRSSTQKLILAERAREFTETALRVLVEVATKSESDSARVSAAVALLDRGHGRPYQAAPYEPLAAQPAERQSAPAAAEERPQGENIFDLEELRAR
jgi:hypothetical protein